MEGDDLVRLANELLSQLDVSRRIRKAEDIDSSFFVTLYEGLCGDRLPDVIRRPKSKEDEAHNCQCVIDSLAMDVLHTSLSHITGDDIVLHNATAVYNLLEIFSGLMEFILHKIEKEFSEDEGRPASTDSAERGLQQLPARGTGSADGRCGSGGGGGADKSGSPTSAIAAGVQRVLDEKQMQSPERKRPRVDRDSSTKSSASRRLRKTPQPLLRPLASSSLQSIVIPSSSDTNYETDSTATGAISDRESRRDANRRASSHRAAASGLFGAEHGRTAVTANDAEPPTKREPASSAAVTVHNRSGASAQEVTAATSAAIAVPLLSEAVTSRSDGVRGERHRVTSTISDNAAVASNTAAHLTAPQAFTRQPLIVGGSTAGTSRSLGDGVGRRTVASSVVPAQVDDADRRRQAGADRAEGVRRETSLAEQLAARMLATGESTAELIELANATFTKEERWRQRPSSPPASAAAAVKSKGGGGIGSGFGRDSLLGDLRMRSAGATLSTPAAAMSSKTIASAEPGRHVDDGTKHTQAKNIVESEQTSAGHATAAASVTGATSKWSQQYGSNALDQQSRGAESAVTPATTVDSATAAATAAAEATAGMTGRQLSIKQKLDANDSSSHRVKRQRGSDSDRRALPTKRHVSFLKDRSSIEETSHVNDSNRRDAESPLWKGLREYVTCLSSEGGATSTGTAHAARPDADSGDRSRDRSHLKAAAGVAAAAGRSVETEAGGSGGGTGAAQSPSSHGGGRRLRVRQVRFDKSPPPLPSTALQNAVTSLERALDAEKRLDERRKLVLGKLYRNGLDEAADELRHEAAVERSAAERRDAAYQRQLRSISALKSRNLNVPRKDEQSRPRGYLLPRERIVRPAACGRATEQSERAKADEKPSAIDRQHQLDPEDEAFIPALLDEFPHLDVAPETVRNMWKKHWQAAKLASKAAAEVKRKKSRAQSQMEEAERKQRLLMHIMKKDIAFGQRMRQKKLQAKAAKEARHELEERRLKTARVRHYYDEYAVQTRSRMLRSRTREEQVFKNLFKKGLEIQKQRIKELRDYAKETRNSRSAEQRLEIEALENYYQDQFSMLTESVTKERNEWQLRERAQAEVLNKIKKEMRERMEKEIQRFQDQLLQDEDDAHFRQLDADRIQLQLKLTRLQTGL